MTIVATEPALEVVDLTAHYGGIQALRGISVKLLPGKVTAVIGANGAGKSTLINCISGLVRSRQGEIRVHGRRIDTLSAHAIARRRVLQVPEGRRVFAPLTVEDNLLVGSRAAKLNRRAEQDQLRYVYGVFPKLSQRRSQESASLSGGEQQMLAVGRALMGVPDILLLDEPSLGLAPVIVDQVYDALGTLRDEGLTMLLVEQNAARAVAFSDYCYILQRGSIVWRGASESVHDISGLLDLYL